MKSFWICLLIVLSVALLAGAELISRDEALKAAFPGAQIESSVLILTEGEIQSVKTDSGSEAPSPLVARYRAVVDGKTAGWAYLDTHIVRTKKESLLVILTPEGKVKRVEVVAFLEPPEYLPPERWYQEFEGKTLNKDLQMNREIHSVTGATLTSFATTQAVRRALAIHQLMQKKEAAKQ